MGLRDLKGALIRDEQGKLLTLKGAYYRDDVGKVSKIWVRKLSARSGEILATVNKPLLKNFSTDLVAPATLNLTKPLRKREIPDGLNIVFNFNNVIGGLLFATKNYAFIFDVNTGEETKSDFHLMSDPGTINDTLNLNLPSDISLLGAQKFTRLTVYPGTNILNVKYADLTSETGARLWGDDTAYPTCFCKLINESQLKFTTHLFGGAVAEIDGTIMDYLDYDSNTKSAHANSAKLIDIEIA